MAMSRDERLAKKRARYQAERQRNLAYAAAYRTANLEKVKQRTADWRERNADHVLTYSRKYYRDHHEQCLEGMRQWREGNRDVHRRHALIRYHADPEAGRAKCRAYRAADADHHRRRYKLWAKAHPEQVREGARRRRARKAAATVEIFNETQVFERDGWRCYICEAPVSRDVPVQDPVRAVVEHVIPLAKGGHHSLANTACACWRCNQMKGAHSTPEQVRERLERAGLISGTRLHLTVG